MKSTASTLLNEARTKLGHTRAQAARAMGVSPATVARWESERHTPRNRGARLIEAYVEKAGGKTQIKNAKGAPSKPARKAQRSTRGRQIQPSASYAKNTPPSALKALDAEIQDITSSIADVDQLRASLVKDLETRRKARALLSA